MLTRSHEITSCTTGTAKGLRFKVWAEVEDYDTGEEHADYTFDGIVWADLAEYAVTWLETRFG